MREGRPGRWGGELRRRRIFDRLAARTGATILERGWYPRLIREAVHGRLGRLPGPLLYRLPRPGPKPRFASSERLREHVLDTARHLTDPVVVAIYDDPVAQAHALGVPMDPAWAAELEHRKHGSIATFRWLVVPTASFGDLIGLDAHRVIVGRNGTDTERIHVGPWPDVPTVGVVSAAAPGRGLELLVEATRLIRETVPDARLRMLLVATGEAGMAYLDGLRHETAAMPWVEIATAPYDRLGEALATTTVLTIPHPPNEYLDVALPVKLFDSAAAGRPLVVTPRSETAAMVREHGIGLVTAGDAPADLAASIVQLLGDETMTRALGARARQVAEAVFDWRVVGNHIADEILRREGITGQ